MTVAQTPVGARRRVGVIAGIILAVVVLGGIVYDVVFIQPQARLGQALCDDMQGQRYADLYTHFAIGAQVSAEAFVAAEQLADQQAGPVERCETQAVWFPPAAHALQIILRRQKGLDAGLTLRTDPTYAKVTSLPDTAILPFSVAYRFCAALQQSDYAGVYALFAPSISAQLKQDDFIRFGQIADQSDGAVDACAITHLDLNPSGIQATATAQAHRQHGDAGGSEVTIQLALQSDHSWRITNLPNA